LNKSEDYQISMIINHRFSLRAKSSIQTKHAEQINCVTAQV